jgi:O-antigen biosynthesis protein WbqV
MLRGGLCIWKGSNPLMGLKTKLAIIVTHDVLVSAAAFAAALFLRFGGTLPEVMAHNLVYALPYALLSVVVIKTFGLYRGIWRYTSTNEMIRILQAVSVIVLVCLTVLTMVTRLENFPRLVFGIVWFLQVAGLAGTRFAYRYVREKLSATTTPRFGKARINTLLIGANEASDAFLREVNRMNPKVFYVQGVLDDEKDKQGRSLHGVPVLGPIINLDHTIEALAAKGAPVDMVILTRQEHLRIEGLIATARKRKLAIKRLPDVTDLAEGESATNLRPVVIEDLLGRPPVKLDMAAIKNLLEGKRVLVTGAGGSIGSELCRQVAGLGCRELVMVESSEFALYEIDMEMTRLAPQTARHPILADVRHADEMDSVFERFKPEVVFHAAAYKHVPLVEFNPVGGIVNNLFGTLTVADTAAKHGVDTMVIISTDKAVNPTNVMGATKRAAEIYCQNHDGTTRFITVRFGNVLGSKGSVVPLFQAQIAAGGPITITDKRMTRYFMTIPEAVQLTIQAGTMGNGGEIFVLDMGKPVNIYDMACEMVRLSGLIPEVDIEIVEVGLRPGEKLFEELLHDEENLKKTGREGIFLGAARQISKTELKKHLGALKSACAAEDAAAAVAALKALVPEYTPAANSPFAAPQPHKKAV